MVSQVWNRAFPIVEALYPGYEAVFMFDNTKSHAIFAKDALRVHQLSKSTSGTQFFIRNNWYKRPENMRQIQPIWYSESNNTNQMALCIQKGI